MGYGDEIMITGYAKILKQKYPEHQIVAGNKKSGIISDSPIFNNNPKINKFSEVKNMQTIWIESYSGNRPYFTRETEEKYYWNKNHKAIPGELYFSEEEKIFGSNIILDAKKWWRKNKKDNFKKIIFVEPSRIKTIKNNSFQNRNWGINKWQSFIDNFKNDYLFIQSVFSGTDILEGIYSFKSNFRLACAVIKNSDFIVGMEGGFTHAAAAVNKTGLFIYGGYIDPKVIGYSQNKNIYIDIDGSPCGMKIICEHCKKCNEIITVEMIAKNFLEMTSV